jgi:hypothetical protein
MGASLVSPPTLADTGIIVKAGTLGIGAGIGVELTEQINLRAGFNAFSVKEDFTETDVEYEGDVDLRTGELLLDWHLFSGAFRMTAGLMWNGNEINADAKPTTLGTFEINDQIYSTDDVVNLRAGADFKSAAPYVGIGWGRAVSGSGRVSFLVDVGAMYQGSPEISVSAGCGTGLSTEACAELQANLAAEQRELSSDADDFKWWPVVSLALTYRL